MIFFIDLFEVNTNIALFSWLEPSNEYLLEMRMRFPGNGEKEQFMPRQFYSQVIKDILSGNIA